MPISEAEMRSAWGLLERVTWELGRAQLRNLGALGLRRRRVFLVRDATGRWLFDAMEGTPELIGLGPEAIWATSASALDRWIAARETRSYVGDLPSLPADAPAMDLRFRTDEPADDDDARGDDGVTLAVLASPRMDNL